MYAKLNIPSGVFADRTDYAAGPAWVARVCLKNLVDGWGKSTGHLQAHQAKLSPGERCPVLLALRWVLTRN